MGRKIKINVFVVFLAAIVAVFGLMRLISGWTNNETSDSNDLLPRFSQQAGPDKTKTPIRQLADPSPAPTTSNGKLIQFSVPFTPQAPFGEWSDPRQQDGCEEASALMAVYWARGISSIALEKAKNEILTISDWQEREYGNYHDTSAQDTADRIFRKYFDYEKVNVAENISADDIITELESGNLVVLPVDGRALGNPFFNQPGPERHMLVVVGYGYQTQEFITNDPGTKSGRGYRYAKDVLFNAVRDYPTGNHMPIVGEKKNMIVVQK